MNAITSLLKLLNGFSYKEKSLLISLAALLVLYGGYFHELVTGDPEHSLGAMLGAMTALVVALVVVHVVFHIVISLDDVDEAVDERDRAVSRRAAVLGYNVLFVAVMLVTGRIIVLGALSESETVVNEPIETGPVLPDGFEIANLLVAALVASEAVYYAAQLYFYRRGLAG